MKQSNSPIHPITTDPLPSGTKATINKHKPHKAFAVTTTVLRLENLIRGMQMIHAHRQTLPVAMTLIKTSPVKWLI